MFVPLLTFYNELLIYDIFMSVVGKIYYAAMNKCLFLCITLILASDSFRVSQCRKLSSVLSSEAGVILSSQL